MLPEPLHVGGSLEKAFGRRVGRLPPEARLLLAVAAAEPAAPQALLWRAAAQLGIDPDAAAPADLGGLAAIGPQVEFRHPLIRSVAYHAIPLRQRRLIHQALAAVGDADERPDRVAWHLGMAARGPDEAVAARLEQAAGRARDRGGYAATVTFLSRAAELSADPGQRARRLLAAAEAALTAGQPVRAGALLEEATPKLGDPLARAQAQAAAGHDPLRPRAGGRGGTGPAGGGAGARVRRCARRPRRRCSRRWRRRCSPAGRQAGRSCCEIADAARAMPAAGGSQASATDLLLDGFAAREAAGYPASVPLFRRAVAMLRAGELSPQEGLRGLVLGTMCRGGPIR